MHRVSVIIPTYNGANHLEETIQSLWAQTMSPLEILVVDDCSTDRTRDVVKSLAPRSPCSLRLLTMDVNSGTPARPINRGIEAAAGELISVLDQDDLFVPQRLEQMTSLFAARPTLSLAVSQCRFLVGRQVTPVPGSLRQAYWAVRAAATAHGADYLLDGATMASLFLGHGNFAVGYPGFLFRRADWLRKGGVDESLRIASDLDMILWLALQGESAFLPRPLYWRRLHVGNLSSGGIGGQLEAPLVMGRYFKDLQYLFREPQHFRAFQGYLLGLVSNLAHLGEFDQALRLFRTLLQNPACPPDLVNMLLILSRCFVAQVVLGRKPKVTREAIEKLLAQVQRAESQWLETPPRARKTTKIQRERESPCERDSPRSMRMR